MNSKKWCDDKCGYIKWTNPIAGRKEYEGWWYCPSPAGEFPVPADWIGCPKCGALRPEFECDKSKDTWFMILNPFPSGQKPSVRHPDFETAWAEAGRIAAKEKCKMHILQLLGSYHIDDKGIPYWVPADH